MICLAVHLLPLCIKQTSICIQAYSNTLAYALGIRTTAEHTHLGIWYFFSPEGENYRNSPLNKGQNFKIKLHTYIRTYQEKHHFRLFNFYRRKKHYIGMCVNATTAMKGLGLKDFKKNLSRERVAPTH